jgi:hypothetical protein
MWNAGKSAPAPKTIPAEVLPAPSTLAVLEEGEEFEIVALLSTLWPLVMWEIERPDSTKRNLRRY